MIMTPYEMRCSGIYKITNIKNNKVYVGSSINMNERRKDHFRYLRENRHANILLQNSFNKYGPENFVFEVLEKCAPEILLKREGYHAKILKAHNKEFGFNLQEIDENGKAKMCKHIPNYEKSAKKRGDFLREYQKNLTKEKKEEIIKKATESRRNNGKPKIIHTCPTCGNQKPRKDSRGCRACYFKFNVRKPREKTPIEVINSRMDSGFYLKQGSIKPTINGKEYHSPNAASKEIGIHYQKIIRWIKNNKFDKNIIDSLSYKLYKNNKEYDEFECTPMQNIKQKRIVSTRMRPIVNGIYFDGVEDAARYTGATKETVRRWAETATLPKDKPWILSVTFVRDDSLRPKYYTPPMPITDLGHLTNPI